MATEEEVQQALLDRIEKSISRGDASAVLKLSEAWAWLMAPTQPHGGGSD